MVKEYMVYLYNGTFFSPKKKCSIDLCYMRKNCCNINARGKSNIKGYIVDDYIYI